MAAKIIDGLNTYFTFRLGSEFFAVNVGQVTKILELTEITKVPNSPKYFKGIINLFGDVIPVFDGRLKFGFQETENTRETCILILAFEFDGHAYNSGIDVDSVQKVLIFEPEQIKSVPIAGKEYNTEFINGMATFNNESVVFLNIEKLFSEDEIKLITTVE
jgi:purine-binding chemotaxis protein CheW